MDNIIESKIDTDILNDVKKFLLMYFKIAGVALVILLFVIFVKSFIMSVMLEGILLYAIWITDLWLLYFMLTGTFIVLGHFMAVNNVLAWYIPNLFVSIILYVIWVTMLWFIYKDFRKNKKMLNYLSLIVLTLPYGLIMISCRTKLKEVIGSN